MRSRPCKANVLLPVRMGLCQYLTTSAIGYNFYFKSALLVYFLVLGRMSRILPQPTLHMSHVNPMHRGVQYVQSALS